MKRAAELIAARYIRDNPPNPTEPRPFFDGGVRRGSDYRYMADMNRLFPDAKAGDTAEAECVYLAERDELVGMSISLLGSAVLELRGERVFRSDVFSERNNHVPIRVDLPMKKGVNPLKFTFKKTALGFGAVFGTWLGKWDYLLLRPDDLRLEGCRCRLNGGEWLPKLSPAEVELAEGEYALFYAKAKDGRNVYVRGTAFPEDGDYVNPAGTEGYGPWLGLWPLRAEAEPRDFGHLTGGTYWRFKYKDMWLRPYYAAGNFGRWSYPLGVTLYGLLKAGETLGRGDILAYVKAHAELCVETFPYALWDRDAHGGAASLHNLLCGIDSLDDCGAFGSFIEEAALSLGLTGAEEITEYIADYIENRQPRLENGAFCRKNQMHSFHNDTVWLDDLYMSVPFLCRRYLLTGREAPLLDAANQLRRYKELLYMEESRLMSHVFDLRHGIKNGVAWGRGNGWALFSLAELLLAMPKNHALRGEMERLFTLLCEGYIARQSADGRWRQVLDDPEAYLETSCTAMFACAFARGARLGLLGAEYAEAARRAVKSIVKNCVDEEGNVYGVCRGSEFSFSPDYYKYELLPRDNDTHGIGIVLLAICEVLK